jgi:hypothetical protein
MQAESCKVEQFGQLTEANLRKRCGVIVNSHSLST